MGDLKRFNTKRDGETLADVLTDIFAGDITKKWLAIKLGVAEETVSRWCKGETVPNVLYFAAMVKHLPKQHGERLLNIVFFGAGYSIESAEPLPERFLDADGDGDTDQRDRDLHLIHAGLSTSDAQLTVAHPHAGRFDLIEKAERIERHLAAAVQIHAGA